MCDESGCQVSDGGSYFSAQVPSGFALSWTIGFWVRKVFSGNAIVLDIASVICANRLGFSGGIILVASTDQV